MKADIDIVIPPDWLEDPGIISSAYGPEEAGYLDDVVGHPPVDDDRQDNDKPARKAAT